MVTERGALRALLKISKSKNCLTSRLGEEDEDKYIMILMQCYHCSGQGIKDQDGSTFLEEEPRSREPEKALPKELCLP